MAAGVAACIGIADGCALAVRDVWRGTGKSRSAPLGELRSVASVAHRAHGAGPAAAQADLVVGQGRGPQDVVGPVQALRAMVAQPEALLAVVGVL